MITVQITPEELEILEDAVTDFVELSRMADYSQSDPELQEVINTRVKLIEAFMDRIQVPVTDTEVK